MKMWQAISEIIQENPEILLFLSLAGGYLLGKLKVKGFSLGTTASVLLVAMVVGQFAVAIPAILKNLSFALFAFCVGYQIGPQFFGALRDLLGAELDLADVTDIIGEALDVCVLNPTLIGKTIGELSKRREGHGLFLTRISRQGQNIPVTRDTVVNKCDVVHIVGMRANVEKNVPMDGLSATAYGGYRFGDGGGGLLDRPALELPLLRLHEHGLRAG
jgi:uncharacterized transporter YbjL